MEHRTALAFVPDRSSNLIASLAGRPLTNRNLADKARRILEADPAYPVILGAEDWLMDGCHRFMHARTVGRPRAWRFSSGGRA